MTLAESGLPALGIDGGVEGAALLLHPMLTVLAALSWRRPASGGDLVLRWVALASGGGRLPGIRSAHRIGEVTARICSMEALRGYLLAVEDIYLGPNPGTAIGLAKWAGACAGPLEAQSRGDIMWIGAGNWRNEAFGIPPRTKRDEAKALTRAALPDALRVELERIGPAIGGAQHIYDAAGIAMWRLGTRFQREVISGPKRKHASVRGVAKASKAAGANPVRGTQEKPD